MKFTKYILSVSTLALMVTAPQAFASNRVATTANEPAYNPATVVDWLGTVTSVRQASPGSPLPGVHLAVKSKTGTVDVYLGPSDYLRFLKSSYSVGEQVEIIGSKVQLNSADVILARQIDDGSAIVTLREPDGASEWQNWGKEIDPALVQ